MLPTLLTHACGSRRIYGELGVKQLSLLLVRGMLHSPLLFPAHLQQSLQPHGNFTRPGSVVSLSDSSREKPEPKGCCALLKAGCSE